MHGDTPSIGKRSPAYPRAPKSYIKAHVHKQKQNCEACSSAGMAQHTTAAAAPAGGSKMRAACNQTSLCQPALLLLSPIQGAGPAAIGDLGHLLGNEDAVTAAHTLVQHLFMCEHNRRKNGHIVLMNASHCGLQEHAAQRPYLDRFEVPLFSIYAGLNLVPDSR